jgi:hypothetical protein
MLLANERTTTGSDGWMKQDLAETGVTAQGNTSAGAGAVTVVIEASDDGVNALATPIGTISLTLGTSAVADGFQMKARWNFIRARVTAISGTGAVVRVNTALKDR